MPALPWDFLVGGLLPSSRTKGREIDIERRRRGPCSRRIPEGAIEPSNERKQRLELARQQCRQSRTGHLRVGKRAPAGERLVPKPRRAGVLVRVSARHLLEHRVVIETSKSPGKTARHAIERSRV